MEALELALAETTALLQSSEKRFASSNSDCSDACLTGKATAVVALISGTIKGVVGKFGVGEFRRLFR
jgi:hypothetical protein